MAGRAGTRRAGFLGPVVALLPREVGVPPDAAASLEPLLWLLRHVGDGVTMTKAGYLPKVLVVAANTAFGWFDLPGFSSARSTTCPRWRCCTRWRGELGC